MRDMFCILQIRGNTGSMKIQIIIDGRMVQVDKGTPVLQAAKKADIVIPTLCYHEALKPYGSCRLCMVEVVQNKHRRLVTSCNFPADTGMEVFTDTDSVKQVRKNILELLLARCPEVPMIQTMARRMGIQISRFKMKESKDCILCGLCVRFCEEVVGAAAIGLSNRGTEREVTTPFKVSSETCIGCGSCTYICPTGCIEMVSDENKNGLRNMNMGRLSIEPCPNDYNCKDCDDEQEFIKEIKSAVTQFRNKFCSGKDSMK
ncbi:2Fe-2S iron-sulfur cluster binding domain-containing protein [bacterium]|nr:MAG: 2Fe-2S iron-sulfur cluster binding domain-containing protein [bacterium]